MTAWSPLPPPPPQLASTAAASKTPDALSAVGKVGIIDFLLGFLTWVSARG
ncbi:hypothetical protein [uncultured Pseudacidovorax sp.]|nr:hypothetical protein [uncultured Pseudacidovorax sp.]